MHAAHPTRRDRPVNHGDKTRLAGNEEKTLVWISVEHSQPFTVYVTARVDGPPAFLASVQPTVTIDWGNGGASIAGEFPVIKRLRVPLAASVIKISARLIDLTTGKAPPPTVSCVFSGVIANGVDGETLRNTRWVAQSGPSGLIGSGPQRVLSVEGYNAAASKRWAMVFDAAGLPPNGSFPLMAAPAAGFPASFTLRRFDTREFLSGVYWAASTSPLTLTYDSGARFRVDSELLL
jgi:hypothetical protein